VPTGVRTLFEDAFAALAKDTPLFRSIYSKNSTAYLLRKLHQQNGDLIWLGAEVALDRCQGDVRRVSEKVCPVDNEEVLGCLLCLLREKVEKKSFEEFCVFSKARQLTKTAECPVRGLDHLLDSMPPCLRHLLWSDGFQLVNEFYLQPLCNVNGKVFVGEAELVWGVSVEPASGLAHFQLKTAFGATGSRLSVQSGQVCIIAHRRDGCLWKVKAVDDAHVKICTDHGILNKTSI
jgi:hypothetical protein